MPFEVKNGNKKADSPDDMSRLSTLFHVHIKNSFAGNPNSEVISMPHESAYFVINMDVGLHDTSLLKRALDSIPGVTSVSINKDESSVAVDYDNTGTTHSDIQKKIEILGYPVETKH